jgi:hypothetical protein
MKYMMLIYSAEGAMTEEQHADCVARSTHLCHELAGQGRFLGAAPLHPSATATCVRLRNGSRLITDGPFAETTEQLGGYYLIDAPKRSPSRHESPLPTGGRLKFARSSS